MKLFEAAHLTHHGLDINWTMLFNEKDDNKNHNSDNNGNQRQKDKCMTNPIVSGSNT